MANNINKQGVWSSEMIKEEKGNPKIWDKINPNLLTLSKKSQINSITIPPYTGNSSNITGDMSLSSLGLMAGDKITVSAQIITATKPFAIRVICRSTGDNRTYDNKGNLIVSGLSYLTLTIPANTTMIDIYFFPEGNTATNSSITYSSLKMEKGVVPTPWIPNEADYNGIGSAGASSAITADNFYEI